MTEEIFFLPLFEGFALALITLFGITIFILCIPTITSNVGILTTTASHDEVSITVLDKMETPAYNVPCSCTVLLSDGNAYGVLSPRDCVKLQRYGDYTIKFSPRSTCEISNVKSRGII